VGLLEQHVQALQEAWPIDRGVYCADMLRGLTSWPGEQGSSQLQVVVRHVPIPLSPGEVIEGQVPAVVPQLSLLINHTRARTLPMYADMPQDYEQQQGTVEICQHLREHSAAQHICGDICMLMHRCCCGMRTSMAAEPPNACCTGPPTPFRPI
jgi:hypothetical protein